MIHFDTVFAPGEAARRPFRREGTRAFGPGVADAKGGVAIILNALAIAKRRGMAGYRTLTVLFNPDEEKGSVGSRELIGRLARGQDYVLSYEPPDGERVIVATASSLLVSRISREFPGCRATPVLSSSSAGRGAGRFRPPGGTMSTE